MCKADSSAVLVSVVGSSTSTQTEKWNRSLKAESRGARREYSVLVIVAILFLEQALKWEVWMCEICHKIEPDEKQILNTFVCVTT
jgi:hypothetical protein